MVHGDLELIIGTKQDPIFGPVVVVGFGGTLVEVLRESRVATAPVTHQHAVEMLTSLRGSDVFGEIRGRAAMDLDMIAEVITRVSWQIGRAHVLTPVTNAHLVCRLLLETKKNTIKPYKQ